MLYPIRRAVFSALTDKQMEIVTVVITNIFAIPTIWTCFRHRKYYEGVISFCLCCTSILYHCAETLEDNILFGQNAGSWHRLDNIFMILSTQLIIFHLCLIDFQRDSCAWYKKLTHTAGYSGKHASHSVHSYSLFHLQWFQTSQQEPNSKLLQQGVSFFESHTKTVELIKVLFLVLTLWMQERGPWKLQNTFIPILLSVPVALFFLWKTPHWYRPQYSFFYFSMGWVITVIGVYFFVIGLDDKNDYLRMNHGLWHTFASLAAFCFLNAKLPFEDVYLQAKKEEKHIL